MGATAGASAVRPGDAADLGLSAAAAVDFQARLVARDGPDVSPATADGRRAAPPEDARAGMFCVSAGHSDRAAGVSRSLADTVLGAGLFDRRGVDADELPADARQPSLYQRRAGNVVRRADARFGGAGQRLASSGADQSGRPALSRDASLVSIDAVSQHPDCA